jgi:hypothetical protein
MLTETATAEVGRDGADMTTIAAAGAGTMIAGAGMTGTTIAITGARK